MVAIGFFQWREYVERRDYHQAENHPAQNAKDIAPPESADDRIADYTLVLAIFTAALVVVSAIQIRYLIRADQTAKTSADAAKAAANAALTQAKHMAGSVEAAKASAGAAIAANAANREFFTAAERPWLALDVAVNSDLTWSGLGASVELLFTIKNTGRLPARNVWLGFDIVQPAGGRDPNIALREIIQRVTTSDFGGTTIFPNQAIEQNILGRVDQTEIDASTVDYGAGRLFIPRVVACVRYEFPYERGSHHTIAVCDVQRIYPGRPRTSHLIADGQPIPQQELVILKTLLGVGTDIT